MPVFYFGKKTFKPCWWWFRICLNFNWFHWFWRQFINWLFSNIFFRARRHNTTDINNNLEETEPNEFQHTSEADTSFLEASSSITQVSSTNKPVPKLYKIVGDNRDKNIKPRYMRTNYKVKSLHYYHYYAVLDRIDVSELFQTM